jgi:tetratricopeptide (TPR) repeat protein
MASTRVGDVPKITSVSGEPRVPTAPQDLDHLLALALSRPHEALANARSLLSDGAPPAVAAVAHQTAAVVLRDFGDIDEALDEFRAAIRSARRVGDQEREADVRAAYGVALVMAGRPSTGLARIDQAAAGASGTAAGRIQVRKAHALLLLGRSSEMLHASQRAVTLLRGSGDLVWQARARVHRAKAYLVAGAITRAEADFESSEEMFLRAGQQLEYASALYERGTTVFARGDLPTALALLDKAQQVVDELGVFEPELHVTQVEVLLAAQLHHDALRVADDAVSRCVQLHGSAARRAELLLAAGLAASAGRDPVRAASRSQEALRMFRRQRRTWWAARAELVLLESRYDTGDLSVALLRAAGRLAGVLESIEDARAPEARLLAGRIALARGRTGTAVHHLRAAATRRSRDVSTRTTGWLARALLAQAEGRHRDLLAACARGLDVVDTHLGSLGASELRAQATAQGADLARLALRQVARTGDPGRLLLWSERWRAIALAVPPVRLEVEPELTRDLAALRLLTSRLRDGGPAVPALAREQRRLEQAVRRRALHQPASRTERAHPLRIADLRSALGDTELVELTDVDGQRFAVVLSGERAPVLHRIGPTDVARRSLDHALFALHREGSRRGDLHLDLRSIGTRLQEAVLGPVVDALTSPTVVIVPTGSLHAVPWALMPGLAGRAVTVVPSAVIWLRGRQAAPQPRTRVVLVGGPHLSTGAGEVRRLAERYPDAMVLADGDATCDRVLAAMDGASLVHVAAHGTFRADSPLLSSLELDDGPLTVYDLERLDRAPDRVVLSSCSSAVGASAGADELLGVTSALMALGARGVVASVVPVDDPGSVPFMLALHELMTTLPLGQALAEARDCVRDDPVARIVAESFIALGA